MYFFIMGFRENLKVEMNYQDIKTKELAYKANMNPRTIEQYLSSAAKMPSAENAVKIAQALDVSVEYLVTGTQKAKNGIPDEKTAQIKMYKKYHGIIEAIEKLPQKKQKTITEMIKQMVEFGK